MKQILIYCVMQRENLQDAIALAERGSSLMQKFGFIKRVDKC